MLISLIHEKIGINSMKPSWNKLKKLMKFYFVDKPKVMRAISDPKLSFYDLILMYCSMVCTITKVNGKIKLLSKMPYDIMVQWVHSRTIQSVRMEVTSTDNIYEKTIISIIGEDDISVTYMTDGKTYYTNMSKSFYKYDTECSHLQKQIDRENRKLIKLSMEQILKLEFIKEV